MRNNKLLLALLSISIVLCASCNNNNNVVTTNNTTVSTFDNQTDLGITEEDAANSSELEIQASTNDFTEEDAANSSELEIQASTNDFTEEDAADSPEPETQASTNDFTEAEITSVDMYQESGDQIVNYETEESSVSDISDDYIKPSAIVFEMSFKEVLESSYSVEWAKCEGIVDKNDEETIYHFVVLDHICGEDIEKEFDLYVSNYTYCYIDNDGSYQSAVIEEGRNYIMPLYKQISIFWDNPIRYYLTAETLITTDDEGVITGAQTQGEKPDIDTKDVFEFKELINQSGIQCSQEQKDIGPKYSLSSDIDEVIKESDCVLCVEMTDILNDDVEDRTTYCCHVVDKYKVTTKMDDEIFIITTKNKAEVGQKYIVAVNNIGETNNFYIISSIDLSVYPVDAPEAQEIIDLAKDIF